jgi:eight-cysteine-cluster-containing protein
MKTNATLILALALGLALAGCTQPQPANNTGNNTTIIPPANNTTGNATAIPPGYEVADYCEKDSDCVRLRKCCDCGSGEYVNTYHQAPACPPTQPQCKCATTPSHGECRGSRCAAVAGEGATIGGGNGTNGTEGRGNAPSGFCGTSTRGACASDSDCMAGGCSGQVCQSVAEPPVISTCEYRDCYDAQAYGLACACISGKCGWR